MYFVCIYDLSILSVSVMVFQKNLDSELYPVFLGVLEFL